MFQYEIELWTHPTDLQGRPNNGFSQHSSHLYGQAILGNGSSRKELGAWRPNDVCDVTSGSDGLLLPRRRKGQITTVPLTPASSKGCLRPDQMSCIARVFGAIQSH